MDVPARPDPTDVLAQPVRGLLFETLTELRRPATTDELAKRVGRHVNAVRAHLRRLAEAGLVSHRTVRQARGRPRDHWAVAPGARPMGAPPEGYGELGRWLARAVEGGASGPAGVDAMGRDIGRELAPAGHPEGVAEALGDVLTALGFHPQREQSPPSDIAFVLGNCPYRDVVRDNPEVVCALHRGITQGLLDTIQPGARLTAFVARDPYEAGCRIEAASAEPTRAS